MSSTPNGSSVSPDLPTGGFAVCLPGARPTPGVPAVASDTGGPPDFPAGVFIGPGAAAGRVPRLTTLVGNPRGAKPNPLWPRADAATPARPPLRGVLHPRFFLRGYASLCGRRWRGTYPHPHRVRGARLAMSQPSYSYFPPWCPITRASFSFYIVKDLNYAQLGLQSACHISISDLFFLCPLKYQ